MTATDRRVLLPRLLGQAGERVRLWLRRPGVVLRADFLSWAALLVAVTAIGILRYSVVRASPDLGWDLANYLTTMRTVFGDDPSGIGLLRPPLIAFPLKLATQMFGVIDGGKALAIVSSVIIAVPFFGIVRRVSPDHLALVAACGFVASIQYNSMLVWGFITFIGIAAFLATLMLLDLAAVRRSVGLFFVAGLMGSVVFGFHQVSAMILTLTVTGTALGLMVAPGDNQRRRYVLWLSSFGAGLLLGSLPYVFTYLAQLDGLTSPSSPSTEVLARVDVGTLNATINRFFPGNQRLVLFGGMSGVVLCIRSRRLLGISLLMLSSLWFLFNVLVFSSPVLVTLASRFNYFHYATTWIGLGVAIGAVHSHAHRLPIRFAGYTPGILNITIGALLILLLFTQLSSGTTRLKAAVQYYNYLGSDQRDMIRWLESYDRSEAGAVAYPQILGWWIEGLGGRRALEVRGRDGGVSSVQAEESLAAELILSGAAGLYDRNWAIGLLESEVLPRTTRLSLSPSAGGHYHPLMLMEYTLESARGAGLEQPLPVNWRADGKQVLWSFNDATGNGTHRITLQPTSASVLLDLELEPGNGADFSFQLALSVVQSGAIVELSEDGRSAAVSFGAATTLGIKPGSVQVMVSGPPSIRLSGHEDRLAVSGRVNTPATIQVTILLETGQSVDGAVNDFHRRSLIAEHCVRFVIVDREPGIAQANPVDRRVVDWLGASPYLQEVGRFGSLHVFEVLPEALAAGWDCAASAPAETGRG